MRFLFPILSVVLTQTLILGSSAALASDAAPMEKVKMGILPAGGLYEVFDVACSDQSKTSVVSIERRRRWCTQFDGQLSCYKAPEDASNAACATQQLASSEQSQESYN